MIKKFIGLALLVLTAICLGACANLPAGPGLDGAANYGSSTPR